MKKYRVCFKINGKGFNNELKFIDVEAGNKKGATLCALAVISKDTVYDGTYKTLDSVEEV